MKQFKLSNGKTIVKPRSYAVPAFLLFSIFLLLSVKVTGFNFHTLAENGNKFFDILKMMIPPKFTYMPRVWKPLLDTVKMSLLGSVVGSMLAIPFAIGASTNIVKNKIIISAIRLFISIVRTLPTLVTALIATYAFGFGTLAGTIAIAVFTFAYVGKLLYEQIETVDMGAFEAMEAMGAGRFRAFLSAICPQIMPGYLSNCLFCFEGNVRYASILGYVGAGGLGLILQEKIGWREYDNVGMILLMLFVTVLLIEGISHFIRSKLS
ncbi:phosphonate ABC transporter, permease protein PhnE [Anaerocolumna cellulosilytica]|uniref:Phosphonate ABC transporter, permease protein PhnE n=1 Tax=Anaerocolumna cellulosilytica TaxID=433286 RepID=A0A6S6RA65_9FIRM|nr:phosphonate ABC transporter, permease protein PhnE [Anaerocolumna cellulosilytica]MBB5195472.1 phosphonate transport system permease protein [Anaerocolumna cellulosilytica]BCJ96005.1 phosphonate ABC transporter, permease protein PhnE [Anaerocolumna cellulosilytica]